MRVNRTGAVAAILTASLLFIAACGDSATSLPPTSPAPSAFAAADDLVPASPEVTAEIKAAHKDYVGAIRAADADALRAMFTDNYQCLRTNGRLVDVETTMRLLELSFGKIDEISFHDETVFMLGEHAYGFSLFRQSGSVGGKPYDLESRALDVFVKRGDRWLVAFTAVTSITGQPGETITDAARER